MNGAARAVSLYNSKAFDRVSYDSLLHKRKGYGVSGWIYDNPNVP